ncbi:ubiquitin-like protein [Streptomyces griseocarneus]|uniref:ubiquitin-like protein n=1 Tax=Streptomyces griseocarneus TaxID=51201 RepID=UPI00167D44DD|nr:ubiquitin-like protein [Streptomyces griseocarneus]MBZ6478108.1 hypothetical protein [Streptomyces griseocarneus]GHG83698.1 hypothetical protein GCM10018779_66920 [Streptomyces griseocarneus]
MKDGQINIKVVSGSGDEIQFKIENTAQLRKVMEAYCKKTGTAMDMARFLYDGTQVSPSITPAELEMKDGDSIDVMAEQAGG